MVRGAGSSGDGAYSALYYIKNKSLIQNNVIKSTGYLGINYQGDSCQVKNNFIDSFDCLMRDGGAIYNYGDLNAHGRRVIGNIVTHGYGDNFGCGADLSNPFDQHVYGIYTDGGTKNVVIDSNTVAFCSLGGYHCNSATNITITNNTFYSNGIYQMNLVDNNMNPYLPNSGFTIKNNIFFATDPKQLVIQMNLASNYLPTIGIIDSNYYCRPINEPSGLDFITTHNYYSAQADNGGGMADVNIPNLAAERFKSLDVWQTYSHQDAHSHKSPKTVTTLNDIKFVYNATSVPSTTALGANYIDVRGRAYNGTITLAPFTSAVLIKTGTSTNQPPHANAGSDQTITAPTSTITLSGTGTDVDGTIASYTWSKIAGSALGTITNTNSASTTVTGLVQGVYKFELKVTDNLGAIGKDTMQVTVNGAANTGSQPPTANAGGNQTIVLPLNSVTLLGSVTQNTNNGPIVSTIWSQRSGPNSATLTLANTLAANATGLVVGNYVFRLTVTDSSGKTGMDSAVVTVSPSGSSINVRLYAGSYPYMNSMWNNWNVGTGVQINKSSGILKYSDGSTSPISAILSYQDNLADNGSPYTAGATMCPDTVLRFTSYTTSTRTLTISGLNNTNKYDLEFFASRKRTDGQKTQFTIGTQSIIVSTDINTSNAATFSAISPSNGSIVVTISRVGTYNYLDGFEIKSSGMSSALSVNQAISPPLDTVSLNASGNEAASAVSGQNDDIQSNSIKIYPNPVRDLATLEINTLKTDSRLLVVITNMKGLTVYRNKISSGLNIIKEEINMGNLSKGVYAVTVYFSNNEKQTIKLMLH